jgi:hypothetical protein
MLLYNWNKIFTKCEGNTVEIVKVLKMLVEKQLPKNRFDDIYKYSDIDFSGQSFLIHPDVLLYNSYKYSFRDVCIYVALASRRPYALYKAYGKITLDLLFLSTAHEREDPFYYLENNRLLQIRNGEVHFLYEEAPKEKH